ncbi:MAG TPA: FAD-dependent oxidoreductase [Acetobacteraceae bacterium]
MKHDMRRVAVVGAGMAGLACAAALHAAGLDVTVFDKGRRAGGRMATRRVDGMAFDHGVSVVTAHTPAFNAAMDGMAGAGAAAPWPIAGPNAWTGVPGASALARYLEGTGVGSMNTGRHAACLDRGAQGWTVRHLDAATARPGLVTREGGEVAGPFDALVLALPAPQAAGLLRAVPHRFAAEADRAGMSPRWTLMIGFAAASEMPDLLLPGGALSVAIRNSAQPGRAAMPECWVAHAGPDWSQAHLEDGAATVQAALVQDFAAATGISQAPAYAAVHRWRYALTETPLNVPALWDPETRLGICGDWCLGARLEDAFTSGRALAEMLGA